MAGTGDDAVRFRCILCGDAVVDDGRDGQAERDRDLGGNLNESAGERLFFWSRDICNVERRGRKEQVREEDGAATGGMFCQREKLPLQSRATSVTYRVRAGNAHCQYESSGRTVANRIADSCGSDKGQIRDQDNNNTLRTYRSAEAADGEKDPARHDGNKDREDEVDDKAHNGRREEADRRLDRREAEVLLKVQCGVVDDRLEANPAHEEHGQTRTKSTLAEDAERHERWEGEAVEPDKHVLPQDKGGAEEDAKDERDDDVGRAPFVRRGRPGAQPKREESDSCGRQEAAEPIDPPVPCGVEHLTVDGKVADEHWQVCHPGRQIENAAPCRVLREDATECGAEPTSDRSTRAEAGEGNRPRTRRGGKRPGYDAHTSGHSACRSNTCQGAEDGELDKVLRQATGDIERPEDELDCSSRGVSGCFSRPQCQHLDIRIR